MAGRGDKMLVVILGISTVICAVGWFVNRVQFYTALYYIVSRQLPEPSKEQWDRCQKHVIRKFLGLKDRTVF